MMDTKNLIQNNLFFNRNFFFNSLKSIQSLKLIQQLFLLIFCILITSNTSASQQLTPSMITLETLKKTAAASTGFVDEFDAAVWMVDMDKRLSRYVKNPDTRIEILSKIHQEASRYQLDPQLVLAVMHVESLFDHYALSYAGAQGLMQVMPFWKKELKKEATNLFDIDSNISFGCLILKTYLKIEKGDKTRALARYNGSLGKTWYPEKVFKAYEKYWRSH